MTIPPGSGAVVMGTGIVSIALQLDHQPALSKLWLALAGAGWLFLVTVTASRLVRDRSRLRGEARSPLGLTGVAATAVLGSRLLIDGRRAEALALLTRPARCG
jgi:tellurite resistance protein TehA-like permease